MRTLIGAESPAFDPGSSNLGGVDSSVAAKPVSLQARGTRQQAWS